MCKDPVGGRHGDLEAQRASDGVMVGEEEVTAGDTGRSWWAVFQGSPSPWATIPLAAVEERTGALPPRAIFTSSVLASIFLWVRASRRTDAWTPRSWINEKTKCHSMT